MTLTTGSIMNEVEVAVQPYL